MLLSRVPFSLQCRIIHDTFVTVVVLIRSADLYTFIDTLKIPAYGGGTVYPA